ncbi:unnamed protein product [Rotaria sp. Silwood1]|nr:unnamed protein product [Rotaria sp. Silwood1]
MAINYTEELLSDVIGRKKIDPFAILPNLYSKRPEPFHARLNDLVDGIFSSDAEYSISVSHLFSIIVKEHPELVTSVQVDHLFASIEACPSNLDGLFSTFQALGYVANVQPHLFHKYRAQLLELVTKQQNVWAFGCLQQYFVASTIIGDENTAN